MIHKVVKLEAKHLHVLLEKPENGWVGERLTPEHYENVARSGNQFTVLRDGVPIFCAGVRTMRAGVGEAWAIFDWNCRESFLHIHLAVRSFLRTCGFKRVQATVDYGFERGHRWLRALGFVQEAAVMKHYAITSDVCSMYAFFPGEAK